MEILSYTFFQRALIGGTLLCIVFSLFSFFVVVRKLSFAGVGISHTAFGGIAIGILLGIDPSFSALIFAILIAIFIAYTSQKRKLHEDAAIGIFFSFSMALGIAIISRFHRTNVDIWSFLFGNITTITKGDLIFFAVATAIVLIYFIFFFGDLVLIGFDPEVAQSYGVNVQLHNYVFMTLLAMVIIMGIKMVGVILISAFLVLPATIASAFSKSFIKIIGLSILVSLVFTVAGLFLSYFLDMPSGATIVMTGTVLFALTYLKGN